MNRYVSKTDSSVAITPEEYGTLSSSERENYILKAGPKLPSASDILYGEIAVNYKDDIETLSIKNNKDEIVEFASKKYVSELIPTPTSLDTDKFLKGDGTWANPPFISYPKGTAQDLNAGTDTAEKVWDAKTIADYVQGTVNALPEPMVFKGSLGTGGTISSLPEASSSNEGFTYKVIIDGTYAGQKAKIGDLFISNGTAWNLVPSGDEPSGTVTNVATGTGLTGGPITTSGTISHADTSSQASVSNSGRTYIQSVTLDGMGHVTGLSSATETVVNTDRYVNNASFADDSTSAPASPVKMTLTRAGSDTATVTANLPKVSSASAGVAPKGAAVTAQSQSTKFLREDGTWAAPSYTKPGGDVTGPSSSTDARVAVFDGATGKVIKDSGFTIGKSVPSNAAFTDTDTKVTSVDNHYVPAEDTSSQLDVDASSTTAATWNSTSLVTGVTVKRDSKGHVVGLGVDSIKMPENPNTDTKVTQILYTGDGYIPLLFATQQRGYPTNFTNIVYRNDSIYVLPSKGYVFANRFMGDLEGTASAARQLVTTMSVGSATQPVYFKYGVPTACSYQLNKTVPSDAVFTDTTYSSKSAASGGTDVSLVTTGEKYTWNDKQNKVGKLGSATKPVYTSADGTFTECSTYAGGTAVTLNGIYLAGSTASFYAPTLNGKPGQFLMATSAGDPAWTTIISDFLPSDTVYSTLGTVTSVSSVPITNRVVVVIIPSGSAGSFSLASGLAKGREVHVIVKNTGSSDYTITIPHSPSATSDYKYINIVDNGQGNVIVPKGLGGYVEINALYDGTFVYLRYA